jgi:hypothetical protein
MAANKLSFIMSQLVQSLARVSHESISLSRALWAARNMKSSSGGAVSMMTTLKPVLLDQARQSNRVATSLLQIEKGYGLLKYLGIRGCIRQCIRVLSSNRSVTDASNNSSAAVPSDVSKDTVPKSTMIAFMITSSMKHRMQETLGYSVDQIKKMTPLQASLVLNHHVSPDQYDDQLPLLEKEYEQEQEEWQNQEKERSKVEYEFQGRPLEQEIPMMDVPPSHNELPLHDTVRDSSSTSLSPAQLASVIGAENGFDDTWFEVVEVQPDGETVRQGLYPNVAEAALGREAREMIRDRQMERDRQCQDENSLPFYSTFEIRQVSRSELN